MNTAVGPHVLEPRAPRVVAKPMVTRPAELWSSSIDDLFRRLDSAWTGLSSEQAELRHAGRPLSSRRHTRAALVFAGQFRSPILLLLIAAAIVSAFVGDPIGAALILLIVVASGVLGFWQEYKAGRAVDELLALVTTTAAVVRDGATATIPIDRVVPGDVVLLAAGDAVPGDARVLEACDLFVDEAALTGESFAAAKAPGVVAADTVLAHRDNTVFAGSHVVTGTARVLVVRTGRDTILGGISTHLARRPPATEFEIGIRRFGHLLLELTLMLVIGLFAVNVALDRPVLDSLLFAVALAVGLTPQLLPAIIGVNLAHGARQMAKRRVIVKRLISIESFGGMDVLCSDKTGTLTQGIVRVRGAYAPDGPERDEVLCCAHLNAAFESGFANPIDRALRELDRPVSDWRKLDEKPWDFARKRLTVLVDHGDRRCAITKGAVDNVLAACSTAELSDGTIVPLGDVEASVRRRVEQLGGDGVRAIGVARRVLAGDVLGDATEREMTFLGVVALHDPLKPDAAAAVARLRELGVALKIITGDNRFVARSVAREVGVRADRVVTGPELDALDTQALPAVLDGVDVFAEVEPHHKERLIAALRRAGHVVGFIGDGINDATALHVADVGVSVDGAVDVAKDAADIVLLARDLGVLADGVVEGRSTFANTMKYVFMATSANFGNMFSMAGASLLLPFLPLLPEQILLMNLLTDLPEMTIARDRVDDDMVARPRRWDVRALRRFMVAFGLLSSVFDFATFAILRLVLHASVSAFRTGWFVESVASAATIVLLIRTRRWSWRSRPAPVLAWTTALVVGVALLTPWLPGVELAGFAPLAPSFYALLLAILAVYVVSAELVKRALFR